MIRLIKICCFLLPMVCFSGELQNLKKWKFINEDVGGAELFAFDDASWRTVNIPHDWAIEGEFNINHDAQIVMVVEDKDKEPKLRTGRTGALPSAGIGWYRTSFDVTQHDLNKHFDLLFDGAMSHAKVYVNGKYVGERPFGYISFHFDISSYLHLGKNTIAVRLENFEGQSRWYSGAGLYRKVSLIKSHHNHIPVWGTYITTPEVSERKAKVQIKTQIQADEEGTLLTEIYDATGKKVAFAESVFTKGKELLQNIALNKPKLWSIGQGNLYRAVSKLIINNSVVDVYETTFGLRTIAYEPNAFLLNGKQVKFKGVCLHHDFGPLGAAFNMSAFKRKMVMMKKMGVNALRTTHNPPAPEVLQLCDEMGILVLVEAFDEWKNGKTPKGYNTIFDQWAEKDLVDLIHRDRNHPSVVMWSIGNEIREQVEKKGAEIAKYLHDICKREDPTRATTAGFDKYAGAIKNGLADAVDIPAWNYKPQHYHTFKKEHPHWKMYGSETASAVSSRGIYKFPVEMNASVKHPDLQLSSYDNGNVAWGCLPDKEFALQEVNDFMYGEFVWTGYDYLGEPSPYNEEWPTRSSYFGLVDLAGIPKDRYYLYQSQWSESEKVLHVLPHWNWEGREGQRTPVMVYTNYDSAELFVNGKSMGKKRKGEYDATKDFATDFDQWQSGDNQWALLEKYRLIWREVTYQAGEIKVVAYDSKGKAIAEKQIKTAGKPYAIRLTAEKTQVGIEDIAFVKAEVVDKEGNVCPTATHTLTIEVSGAGTFKAAGNGDATNLEPFSKPLRSLFSGAAMIYVEPNQKGRLIVKSTCKGLIQAEVSIEVY